MTSTVLEQLLATLAVDAATASVVTDRIVIIQRDPQPDESGIGIDTNIEMLAVDLSADPEQTIEEPSFVFLVNGEQVGTYGSGVFTPIAPWSGSVVLYSQGDPYVGWKITLVPPPGEFESEETVTVSVQTDIGDGYGYNGDWGHFVYGHDVGGGFFEIQYQFQIQDLTPPKLLSAVAVDAETIRITFDESMATTGAGSILDIDNWQGTIERRNVDPLPGVNLTVVGVEEIENGSGAVFDIEVNWEMTQGCPYRLTVDEAVEDANGNQIDSDHRIADLVGFQFAAVPLRRFNHWTMMIPLKNRQEDLTRDLERFSNCIAEVLGLLIADIDKFTDQFDPDLATDEQIDAMLYDMGNPFTWPELELTADDKRKLLRVLVEIYKLKGTAVGIESTIQFILGHDVTVVPYMLEGWVLGVDELGEGSIAQILCEDGETFDFSSPQDLLIEVDGYYDMQGQVIEQMIEFEPSDFIIPTQATADEVVAVITDQLNSGGAYTVAAGTAAQFILSGAPFTVAAGNTVEIDVNGEAQVVTLHQADFIDPAQATAEELAHRFAADLDSVKVTYTETEMILTTMHTGLDASIVFTGGTGLAGLGLSPGDDAEGTDAKRLAVYSDTAGVGAWIRIVGGTANDILNFGDDTISGTGGAILAPEDSYQLYSFDIETEEELDDETKTSIRLIAEYLKVAHEHLVNIRTAPDLPWPEGWVLGVSELDISAELGN